MTIRRNERPSDDRDPMNTHRPDPAAPAQRAAYRRPLLKVYGEIRTVTLSNNSNNMNDKGNGSFSMT